MTTEAQMREQFYAIAKARDCRFPKYRSDCGQFTLETESYARAWFAEGMKAAHQSATEQMKPLVEYLRESADKMADSDMMFCINGAHEDFSHLPYEDVKAIVKRVCGVIASRNRQALATIERQEKK